MKLDHNQNLLVKAQLTDLLDTLRLTSYESSPVQFLMRLEQIREHAAHRGLTAVSEIAATFEVALQHVGPHGGSSMVVENFTAILDDAIGVAHLHPAASEAMLASVAMRLRN
jgi:hypothetical protein